MPPILLTPRLRLRPPRREDLEDIYRLGSSPQVMRFITPGRTQNREEARQDLEKRMATAADPLGYWITERKESRAFIGWMALKPLDNGPAIEIGYRFLEDYWGLGYATEGGQKILDYAFRTLKLEKVVAVAIEENRASTRVMEKIGMRYQGRGRYYGTDCVCYEISREGFLAASESRQL